MVVVGGGGGGWGLVVGVVGFKDTANCRGASFFMTSQLAVCGDGPRRWFLSMLKGRIWSLKGCIWFLSMLKTRIWSGWWVC